ncbi:hypothetical protein EB796_019694 [Bugula neritina]|uniref:Uncharacterized protein n=1 Tax=Bugula neritina TaxID=10212 RepID=A0A7J7J9E5_BUGNE|nr:hypothetical protein EB796_019694 [Bugula neritina]
MMTQYIEKAKQKIKHAASEAAESFVHQKTSQLKPELLFDMDMSLTLDAPLIVLPCTLLSTQVLVGELGKMTVTNKREVQTMPPSASDIISIQIRDMKLVTKDVDPLKTTLFGQEVILDEAGVNMTIVHKQVSEAQNDITGVGEFLMEISTHEEINHRAETRRYLDMSADIPHALQLSLSRQAYELTQQAIQTATLDSTSPPAHSEQPSDTSLDSPETAPDVDVEEAFLQINANVTIPVVSVCIKDELVH